MGEDLSQQYLKLLSYERLPNPSPRICEPVLELFLADARRGHELCLVMWARVRMGEMLLRQEPVLQHCHRLN
jgi:hypothetical protein